MESLHTIWNYNFLEPDRIYIAGDYFAGVYFIGFENLWKVPIDNWDCKNVITDMVTDLGSNIILTADCKQCRENYVPFSKK